MEFILLKRMAEGLMRHKNRRVIIMTDNIKNLLENRNNLKKKKPAFIRQEGHKKKNLKGWKWRKPKGMHSKMRRMLRGNRRRVEPGWGSPSAVKGLSSEGIKRIVVATFTDLQKINLKTEGAVISAGVGTKRRIELIKKAKEMGIKVMNYDADKFIAKIEGEIKQKAELKAKTSKVKEEKQKEKEKKAAEKEKQSKDEEKKSEEVTGETVEEETKKDHEKKEFDKLLTKKDSA
jgi:large subunit ribosomal protein L32e